jgi:hypothetical protein
MASTLVARVPLIARATGNIIESQVYSGVSRADLTNISAEWTVDFRRRGRRGRAFAQWVPDQDADWNWTAKATGFSTDASIEGYCLRVAESVDGIMYIDVAGRQ